MFFSYIFDFIKDNGDEEYVYLLILRSCQMGSAYNVRVKWHFKENWFS